MELKHIEQISYEKYEIEINISRRIIKINTFFSMECLRKLLAFYEECSDYKQSFTRTVHYMYLYNSKMVGSVLTEKEFFSIADTELEKILNAILDHDEYAYNEYVTIEAINMYERFYKANAKIYKSALKTISDSAKNLTNRILIPEVPDFGKIFVHHNELMQKATMAHMETFNQISSTLAKQAQFVNEQIKNIENNYSHDLPKFEFPQIQSIVDNLPKFTIDIENILTPFAQQISQMQEDMRRQLSDAISLLINPISSIDFSMLTYHREWSEKHDFLVECGWFYLNEVPKEVINSIYERRYNITSDEVDGIISHYFRKNRCHELKKIIQSWDSSIYFKTREWIFHEALVNHSRKYYNSSTTMLVLHTEGVITDFVRLKLQMPRFKAHKAITDITEHIDDIPMKMMSVSDWKIYNCVFERILDSFKEGFSHANPDNASNGSRDKIAHGHAVERETEVSSLKHFLYLNEIYRLYMLFDEKNIEKNGL